MECAQLLTDMECILWVGVDWILQLLGTSTVRPSFQYRGMFLLRSPISPCRKQKDPHTASLTTWMSQAVKDLIMYTPARAIRACVQDVNEQAARDSTWLRAAKRQSLACYGCWNWPCGLQAGSSGLPREAANFLTSSNAFVFSLIGVNSWLCPTDSDD